MKKFLTAFLLLCACAFSTAAIACNNEVNPNSSTGSNVESNSSTVDGNEDSSAPEAPKGEPRKVTFETGVGFKVLSNLSAEGTVAEGDKLTFEVELSAFYTGSPLAYVNGKAVAPNGSGVYSYTVGKEDLTVRIDGVRKDISNMSGSGTMDDAFVVTKPIDLLFIAEQVNAGKREYCTGAYVLANDIDCKGEALEVIGNYANQSAIFSGSFACLSNSETGEIQRHTISNFVINSENSNYVGLFGAVFSDMSVTSSGLFYGIRLDNFTINAGTNQMSSENKTISCGSLVGYGVGANFYLCDATNGSVNVVADQNYFSFVGGLVGYQQGFYDSGYDLYYPTEVSYAKVDVDVNILGGLSLYSGGIVGFATTNYPYGATASVQNSYALGDVNGALRSGGVAGGLGQYTTVSNCYATGEISARSYQRYDSPLITSDDYCYAYAGGLVGYAENDSIVNDCFFNGTTYAFTASGKNYEYTNPFVGGGDKAGYVSATSEKYLSLSCLENIDLSDTKLLTRELGWLTQNWTFTKNNLPVINYEASEGTLTASMTVHYLAPSATGTDKSVVVDGNTKQTLKFFDTSIQSLNGYNPIGSFMGTGSLPLYYEAENGYLSYGYFFDAECTQRVPYSYLPMKSVDLYVGFADPTPLLDTTYHVVTATSNAPLSITFSPSGMATYTDGATTQSVPYSFDGRKIYLDGARLARYYQGEIVVDDEDTSVFADSTFDLKRYDFFTFLGEWSEEGILLYDGTYFTATAPLVCKKNARRGEYFVKDATQTVYYAFYGDRAEVETVPTVGVSSYAEYDTIVVNGTEIQLSHSKNQYAATSVNESALTAYDGFKGSWVKSATVSKIYTFDGMGTQGNEGVWEYRHLSYNRTLSTCDEQVLDSARGTYTVTDGVATLTLANGGQMTATFNAQGFLEIVDNGNKQVFQAENSHAGVWVGSNYELRLNGIREDGVGEATLLDDEGFSTKLTYERSETENVIAFYSPNEGASKGYLYGYASYDLRTNTLRFVMPNEESESGFAQEYLYLYDNYYGEWVCDDSVLQNVIFEFDGKGLYSHLGMKGYVSLTENGTTVKVPYELDASLDGQFSYKGKGYLISYNEETNDVTVSLGTEGSLQRKDELGNIKFIALDGTTYAFDGKGTLSCKGTFTVNGTTSYQYAATENGFDVFSNTAKVGEIVKKSNHYLLTVDNQSTELYIENEFMGDWAISNAYALFKIGPTDTNGVVKANFKGYDVEMTYLDPDILTFYYRDGKMPYTYYVYVIYDETTKEDVLVLSEFTNLAAGEYFICSRVNDLFGTWEWNRDDGKTTLKFDGVNSSYVNGYATLTLQLNHVQVVTPYFYMLRDGGIIMWSSEMMADRTWYFRLDLVPENEKDTAALEENAYVLYDEQGNVQAVLRKTEVDGLYLTKAFDKDGTEYFFDFIDGKSTLLVGGVAKYTYVIKSYNDDDTATLHVTDIVTDITYEATLDYSDSTHFFITLGDRVVEEAE